MIRYAVTTPASPHEVWALLADPPTWPSWTPTMRSVTPVRHGDARAGEVAPVSAGAGQRLGGVGASYRIQQPRLPAAVWTVTWWEPEVGFGWESQLFGVTSVAEHRIAALGHGTRIELTVDWTGPSARVVRLLLGRVAARFVRTEAEQLAAASTGFR